MGFVIAVVIVFMLFYIVGKIAGSFSNAPITKTDVFLMIGIFIGIVTLILLH